MPYVHGPFALQDQSSVAIAPGGYNFSDDAGELTNSIGAAAAEIDNLMPDLNVLGAEPADPFPEIDLNHAMDLVGVYANATLLPEFDNVLLAVADADQGLATAIGFAPAEAWQDPATPFVTPLPAETIAIPVIPPGVIDFSITGSVGGGAAAPTAPTGLPGTGVTLTNLTAFGNANFKLGDVFQVAVTGHVGETVRADGILNGDDLGASEMGTIGADGTWSLTGKMDVNAVGVWTENWYVGFQLAATFNFVVVDQ